MLAGGGPEEEQLRARLGDHATFLGWLGGEELARAYASADVFLFASRTDTFGQVILEAQASGLPVVAVDEGGPASLIEHGETGLLPRRRRSDRRGARCSLAGDAAAGASGCAAPRWPRSGSAPGRPRWTGWRPATGWRWICAGLAAPAASPEPCSPRRARRGARQDRARARRTLQA